MSGQSTPGPWLAGAATHFTDGRVRTPPLIPVVADTPGWPTEICLVWAPGQGTTPEERARCEANLRAILALPDLLRETRRVWGAYTTLLEVASNPERLREQPAKMSAALDAFAALGQVLLQASTPLFDGPPTRRVEVHRGASEAEPGDELVLREGAP